MYAGFLLNNLKGDGIYYIPPNLNQDLNQTLSIKNYFFFFDEKL